jgi:hypothetical protein
MDFVRSSSVIVRSSQTISSLRWRAPVTTIVLLQFGSINSASSSGIAFAGRQHAGARLVRAARVGVRLAVAAAHRRVFPRAPRGARTAHGGSVRCAAMLAGHVRAVFGFRAGHSSAAPTGPFVSGSRAGTGISGAGARRPGRSATASSGAAATALICLAATRRSVRAARGRHPTHRAPRGRQSSAAGSAGLDSAAAAGNHAATPRSAATGTARDRAGTSARSSSAVPRRPCPSHARAVIFPEIQI